MIYLDNAATTKPNETALCRAQKFATENFYNPSALYGGGICVQGEIGKAREFLKTLIAGEGFELVFTSGGTEADNHAVLSYSRRGNAVTTLGEHSAVYHSFKELKNRGVEPRFAPLNRDGSVDLDALLSLVDDKTGLVSVVHVNNETGAINDISEIAMRVKRKNPQCLFHSDGVQAFGKIPLRLSKEIDLYSISAHKIGGLKGTGALLKRKTLSVSPLIYGGGQERGNRSGTENVLGILCFAYAAEEKFQSLATDFERLKRLKQSLWEALDKSLFRCISPENGTPYILTVAAEGLRGEILQRLLEKRGVIVGTGSACSSKKPYSRVIQACGYENEILNGILRISFFPGTSERDIDTTAKALNACAWELSERIR